MTGRSPGSGHPPAAQPCCLHGKTLSRATSGHGSRSMGITKTKPMLRLLMQQTPNIQEHGDLEGNQEPALSFAVIIIKNPNLHLALILSHTNTCFTAIRKRAFLKYSVMKTQYGSLGEHLLLGLGPVPLSDTGRDFLHPGSMAHGMHTLSSTIPHAVGAASPAMYLRVSNPQTSSPSMQTPEQSYR